MTSMGRRDRPHGTPGRRLAIRRSLPLVLLVTILAGSLPGCATAPPSDDGAIVDVDADSVIVHGAAASATTAPDGRQYQFRAVCLEARHQTTPFVMSKWTEDIKVAQDLGHYHADWKAKGHHWVIQRRVKR